MQRILIPLVFMLTFSLKAQIKSQIYVDGRSFDKLQVEDSVRLINHLNKLQIRWINDGFYFSGIDSVEQDSNRLNIYMHQGEKLKARLSGFKGKRFQSYLSKQLKSYTDNGYPFASIMLDSATLSNGYLNGSLMIETGPEITYDSAYFFNKPKTNRSYIYQLLDVVPGEAFSESDYRRIAQKTERSSFLSLQRPTDLSFSNKKARVYLDIKESTSSTFQGVVGLQQVQEGKTTAVGMLELDIQNLFRSGKQFRFAWDRFAEESQSLDIFYKHPFIFNAKISPSFNFNLLKQDTTFLTRRTGLGIHTYVTPRVELLLAYEGTTGTLLSNDLESIRSSGLADFNRKIYSIQLSQGNISMLNVLKNGCIWKGSSSAGRKKVEKNLNLPDSYYDSIQAETNFYRIEATLAYQLRLMKRQAFYHHVSAGTLKNDELLRNELYRLGGLNSLRGFNEKNFFAQDYILSRAEFRSFFENSSYAYIFYDQLIFRRGSDSDNPLGLGLGFALATSAGQFSFAMAVGRSEEQSISFSTMKAHFGYISRF